VLGTAKVQTLMAAAWRMPSIANVNELTQLAI
jgi:hypothetical protein